jgi:hypothetical protein
VIYSESTKENPMTVPRLAAPVLALALLGCSGGALRASARIVPPEGETRERNPNGLDLNSTAVRNLDKLTTLIVDADRSGAWRIDPVRNPDFRTWVDWGREESLLAMRYLVACAYPKGITVTYQSSGWSGLFGLARRNPSQPVLDLEDRFLVSACMLAHANQRHASQPISLRGGGVAVRPGEDFAMGYPEGVFYGDLFSHPRRHRPERYAMSLNVPATYDPRTARWVPANAVLGRRADFDGERVVEFQGACQGWDGTVHNADRFGGPEKAPLDQRTEVCASGPITPTCRETYRPIVVYGPRLVNAEDAAGWGSGPAPRGDATKPLELFSRGGPPVVPCAAEDAQPGPARRKACLGAYETPVRDSGLCGWAGSWANDRESNPATVRLPAGAEVRAVLRALTADEEDGAGGRGSAFTAIVRFRTDRTGSDPGWRQAPGLRKRDAGGRWVDIESAVKWDTRRGDDGFAWLEVYPIYLLPDDTTGRLDQPGRLSLSIGLVGNGDGSRVEIDAIGFLHEQPSCCDAPHAPDWCAEKDTTGTIAGVCPSKLGLR